MSMYMLLDHLAALQNMYGFQRRGKPRSEREIYRSGSEGFLFALWLVSRRRRRVWFFRERSPVERWFCGFFFREESR